MNRPQYKVPDVDEGRKAVIAETIMPRHKLKASTTGTSCELICPSPARAARSVPEYEMYLS